MIYRGKDIKLPKPIELARQGSEGKDWYEEAHDSVTQYAKDRGLSVKRVADILAITSPRVSVKRNVGLTVQYLERGSYEGMMIGRIRALQKYERTGEFSGPKVTQFSKALQGDYSAVVVDSWMIMAFGFDNTKKASMRTHKHISKVVRNHSTLLGWEPAETQAAMWVAIRRLCGFTSQSRLLMPT